MNGVDFADMAMLTVFLRLGSDQGKMVVDEDEGGYMYPLWR